MSGTDRKPRIVDMHGRDIPMRSMRIARSAASFRPRNYGYSNLNANPNNKAKRGWRWQGGGPDDDIVQNLPVLRQMSRQLEYDSSIVDGLFTTRTTLAIGKGLIPEPIPDMGYLDWTSEQAQKFKSQALRYWEAWAESPRNCDARAHDNFYELTRIASRSQDREGDVFSTLPRIRRPGGDCEVKVSLIEADCIDNPNDISAEEQKRAGIDVFGGVAESPHGQVLGYWVCTDHPNAKRKKNRLPGFYKTPWYFVPSYSEETGEPLILHLMETKRVGQRRGVPVIASSTEILLLIDRFAHAYATKAEIQALFTAVIMSEKPDATMAELGALMSDEEARDFAQSANDVELGPGIVQVANPGDKIQAVESTAPTGDFGQYIGAGLEMIGPSVGVSKGFLTHTFPNSFSAARAETGLTWQSVIQKRAGMIVDFNQPFYEAVISEGVARGYIDAPRFFDDEITRRAYVKCRWRGPGMPQIEPERTLRAYKEAMSLGIMTGSEAATEFGSGDYYENIAARGREIEAATAVGLVSPTPSGQSTASSKEGAQEGDGGSNGGQD